MSENQTKIDAAAEKAFAQAAEKKASAAVTSAVALAKASKPVATASAVDGEPVAAATPERSSIPKKPAVNKTAPKAVQPKKVLRKSASKRLAANVSAPAPARLATNAAKSSKPASTLTQLKDKIMATTNSDFTTTAKDAVADLQSRAKAAYEKGTEMTGDVTAFHKGNFDAIVESGKVFAAGMQDMGRSVVEDAKSAAETVTADVKAMAAVKSPTELFTLQGEIARRNLDTLVAKTSKNAEVMMKLANDMFAPISTRASVAMERLTKAA